MSAFSVQRLRRHELGMSPRIGDGDALARSLYCNMKPVASWDPFQLSGSPVYGGIFNLEFSPGGSLLVAACEKKSVLIFDPLTHERIHTVNDAHADCVNCVKFLDGRMFATCSDDTTIALWDVRNLKKKIRTLSGHSNWVKNIEYSVKDNLLVTSGLDGSIYTWDINSYTEWSLVYQRVFHASGLMRCRISPDASQMVMCTTGGLLVIIHDLNLSTLARDLQGFKPNLYRLMQMSQQLIPIAACYDRLFDAKRHENRVEFVTDFPDGNDAEVVSSLQIHPQGWSALSRNISHDDRSEWTCIHDIQPDPNSGDKSVLDRVLGGGGGEGGEDAPPQPALLPQRTLRCTLWRLNGPHAHRNDLARNARDQSGPSGGGAGRRGGGEAGPSGGGGGPSSSRAPPPAPSGSGTPATSAASSASEPASRVNQSVGIQNDVWEASITIKQHRTLQEMARRGQVGRNFNMQRIMGINTGITPPAEPPRRRGRSRTAAAAVAAAASSASSASATPPASINDRIGVRPLGSSSMVRVRYLDPDPDEPEDPLPEHEPPVRTIRQNKKRLLYYTQETNEGKGFIKELCFSSDGRLVCSPFGYGIRLLALNEQCSELSHCVEEGGRPRGLVELGQSAGQHPDLVVSSKFSPRHYLLVSGCLAGKVVWYQPVG